ncbi:MAG: transposase, partial [Anaerolineae bacterium]|nr:transposase [Anaerolineae bacterium]
FPPGSQLLQDTGFQGYRPENVVIYQPKKKPRGGELTLGDRFLNSVIASARIIVENIICGIKRCRILKDTFRNHMSGFDDKVIEIACGLHNFRVRYRHSVVSFNLFHFVS